MWPRSVGDTRARAVAYLEPVLADVIHELKYRRRRKAAERLGRWMARVAISDPDFRSCDGILAVPMRPEKVRERGYNPSQLLAEAVAGRTGLPVLHHILIKTRSTRSQTEVSAAERIRNPRGSFGVRDSSAVDGKRLILVDDVLTSGSTAAGAASVLLDQGAAEVVVLTAARAPVGRGEGTP